MPVTKEEIDGKISPVHFDSSQQGEHKKVVSEREDEHNGQMIPKEKQQSFSRGFQRSFSLDNMLSDEHESEHSEANWRTQVIISIPRSR